MTKKNAVQIKCQMINSEDSVKIVLFRKRFQSCMRGPQYPRGCCNVTIQEISDWIIVVSVIKVRVMLQPRSPEHSKRAKLRIAQLSTSL